jgi:hypothetical protein
MGKMKALLMEQQEAMGYPGMFDDGPMRDPEEQHLEDLYYAELAEELGYWEDVASEYDAYMESVRESGFPIHLVEMYGYPRASGITDELPCVCRVCDDYTAPGNEYCGTECREIYHKVISNRGKAEDSDELPF